MAGPTKYTLPELPYAYNASPHILSNPMTYLTVLRHWSQQ